MRLSLRGIIKRLHCCSDLLAFLFEKRQFSSTLLGHSREEIDKAYVFFLRTIIDKINDILYFDGYELTAVDSRFIVRAIGTKVEVQAPKIKNIDRNYIKNISERAMENINQNDFDSAITKARTLLEEVFCYAIEKKNETPSKSGNINDLYKQIKDLYHMHGDANMDKRINTLLSGLEKIISSISEMRNKNSDAHGVGSTRIPIKEHHARLFVNASITMADFILSIETEANGD